MVVVTKRGGWGKFVVPYTKSEIEIMYIIQLTRPYSLLSITMPQTIILVVLYLVQASCIAGVNQSEFYSEDSEKLKSLGDTDNLILNS